MIKHKELIVGEVVKNYFKIICYSTIIGITVGSGTSILISFYHLINDFSTELIGFNKYFIILIPTVGILVAYTFVHLLSTSKKTGAGSHRLLEAYHYEGGRVTLKDTLLSPIASAITIGSGGSAGFEGPALLLGGGLSSQIAQRLGLRGEDIRTFLLAGASAGIAAVFKAPLTGIMFGLEVPFKRDIARKAFIPATIASISSYIIFILFQGQARLFTQVPEMSLPLSSAIFDAFLLGLFTASAGIIFVKAYQFLGATKRRLKINQYFLALLAGLIVGLIGFYFPQTLGTGYSTINAAINGNLVVTLLFALIVGKILLTCITLRLGGSGGLFIPSIFVGAMVGAIYVAIIPGAHDPTLVLAAMGASIAVTNKTLLTGVAFVAETTGPSSIILTLITAATAYFVSGNISFYEELQPEDELEAEESMINIIHHQAESTDAASKLVNVQVKQIMHPEPTSLEESLTIGEASKLILDLQFKEYPITDEGKRLLGVLTLEDFLLSDEINKEKSISTLSLKTPQIATPETNLMDVTSILLESEMDNLYIVKDYTSMKLVGVINETEILKEMIRITKKGA